MKGLSQPSALYLDDYQYEKKMGDRKLAFKSIPEDYYPLTCCEVILYSFFVLGIIAAVLGIMIGFLFWIKETGLELYTIIWSIIFVVFVFFLIIAFYIGGRDRIQDQKKLLQEAQQKQDEVMARAKKLNQREKQSDE